MPLLKHAASVTVVEIADDDEMAEARQRVDDVLIWLVSHGVAAEAKVVASRQDDSEQLCSLAHDLGADMIVAGAYGHSGEQAGRFLRHLEEKHASEAPATLSGLE